MNSFLRRIIFRKTLTGKNQPIIIPDKQKIEYVQAMRSKRYHTINLNFNFGIK